MTFRTNFLASTLMMFTATACVSVSPVDDTASNKDFAEKALTEVVANLNSDKIETYFGPVYIQHNPEVADGVDGLQGMVSMLSAADGFQADFIRVIAEDDMVAFHGRYVGLGPKPMISFDVFRLEGGKIVEHWDNLIEEQVPNPSGHTQIDGATEITDLDKTAENKAKVLEFITKSLINGENVDYTQYINPTSYVQHNPQVADGLEGFGAFMKDIGSKGIVMKYDEVHYSVAEGNFVLTASEGSFGGKPQAFYDLFRLKGGLIVEHWDVIADMPGPNAAHNESGKF